MNEKQETYKEIAEIVSFLSHNLSQYRDNFTLGLEGGAVG